MGGLAVDHGGHAVLKKEASMSLLLPPPPPHVSTIHVGDGGKQLRLKGGETARAVRSQQRAPRYVLCCGVLWWLLGAPKFKSMLTAGDSSLCVPNPAGRVRGKGGSAKLGKAVIGWWWWWWWWWLRQGEGDAGPNG